MVNVSRGRAGLTGLLFLCLSVPALADDANVTTVWSTGLEYATGTYGGDVDIEDLYLPVGVSLNFPKISLDLTVPYLSVRAPSGTTVTGPGGEPVPGTGDIATESGLGDVIAGITIYDVVYNEERGIALDLTGRVKFGTADVGKGLGTGEQDFTVRADLYKYLEQFTLLGSVGYKFRGDPDYIDLENVVVASIGGLFYPGDRTTVGLVLDFRESAIADGDAVSELSAFIAQAFDDRWSVQIYVFTGFTDSSSDWGGGLLLTAS